MMNIEKEQLKLMLQEAYDAGWRGSLELKESYADGIVETFSELDSVSSKSCKKHMEINYDSGETGGTATMHVDMHGIQQWILPTDPEFVPSPDMIRAANRTQWAIAEASNDSPVLPPT